MSTKAQWFNKFKSWLPTWVFDSAIHSEAIYRGLAKTLETSDIETTSLVDKTFIDKAVGEFLDLHGLDRNLPRFEGESDSSYAVRIKGSSIQSKCDKISLKELIDKILVKGECVILEDYESDLFLNRDLYLNRGRIFLDKIVNTFTIIVDQQSHDPYSFSNRENFLSFDFIGQNESDLAIFISILNIVNNNKAFGTLYRIVERAN